MDATNLLNGLLWIGTTIGEPLAHVFCPAILTTLHNAQALGDIDAGRGRFATAGAIDAIVMLSASISALLFGTIEQTLRFFSPPAGTRRVPAIVNAAVSLLWGSYILILAHIGPFNDGDNQPSTVLPYCLSWVGFGMIAVLLTFVVGFLRYERFEAAFTELTRRWQK